MAGYRTGGEVDRKHRATQQGWAIAQVLSICSYGAMQPGLRQLDSIIFDCDGVLVDGEVPSCRCLSKVMATCGIWAEGQRV
ncbi:MAG: hypothetical protein JOZ74_14885 [Bradyrhizobium sp.]|nr:hypothetical protein [Bradyrhizobium sp.]